MKLAAQDLLIIGVLGFVTLLKTRTELLFWGSSQRCECGAIIGTLNLPSDEPTEIFGKERLNGAILVRLTGHAHIPEMNVESYRLRHSRKAKKLTKKPHRIKN